MLSKTSHARSRLPETDFVEAPDRWRLATYRYPGRPSRRFPVILIHGFGTNRFDVDFPDPHFSLAKYLHAEGFDTWIIELRGTGNSHRRGVLSGALSKICPSWTFDDYVFKDMPALVGHIQKETGREKLHWVGHSLGGTLIYAAIETLGNGVCASATTLGSAMSASAKHGFVKMLLKVDPLVKSMPYIPMKRMAKTAAPVSRWLAPLEDNFFYAIDNVDIKMFDLALKVAVENLSTDLFLQLHGWYKQNHFRSLDGSFSYRDHLKKIRAPFMVCAGSVDGLTPYPDVHFAFRQIASKDKKFQVFGRETGCRTEYGHLDLVLGKNAPREVFPAVVAWMEKHDKK